MSRKRFSPEQIMGELREAEVALAQRQRTTPASPFSPTHPAINFKNLRPLNS